MTINPLPPISCGDRDSSTQNLAAVKKKGIHRASTVYPPAVISSGRMNARLLIFILVPAAVAFQLTAAWAQAPAAPTPSPPAVVAKVLTLDECIAIALEAQPRIQATLADYAAARYRVNQALAPLLPQLSGAVTATRSRDAHRWTSAPLTTAPSVGCFPASTKAAMMR